MSRTRLEEIREEVERGICAYGDCRVPDDIPWLLERVEELREALDQIANDGLTNPRSKMISRRALARLDEPEGE